MLVTLAALFTSLALAATPLHEQLDSIVESAATDDGPGLVIAVFDGEDEIYRRSRGLANLSTREPLTPATPIYIASLAKTMTSAAIFQLADESRLSIDDPITNHIPTLPDFARDITIRHLLNHTSGLPDYDDLLTEQQLAGATNERVLAALEAAPAPQAAPGEKWSYCNAAYVLLAEVIERIEDAPLPEVLERRFFAPLGMTSTWMQADDAPPRADVALAYKRDDDAWTPSGRTNHIYGPGGVYSTLDDLILWTRAFISGDILSDWAMQLAITPAQASGKRTPYSCGWQPEDIGGRGPLAGKEYVASFGSLGGYQCEIVWFPADDLWYIALSNAGAFIGPPEIADPILAARANSTHN